MMLIRSAGCLARHGMLRIGVMWLAAALSAAACAQPGDENAPTGASEPSSVGSVVDLPTDEAAYADVQSCISMRAIRSHTILDSGHIVFHLPRGRYVLSQLKPRCSSLRNGDVIRLNPSSIARLCALDKVEVLGDARGPGGLQVIATCALGAFEEISREQLLALKAELQPHR